MANSYLLPNETGAPGTLGFVRQCNGLLDKYYINPIPTNSDAALKQQMALNFELIVSDQLFSVV